MSLLGPTLIPKNPLGKFSDILLLIISDPSLLKQRIAQTASRMQHVRNYLQEQVVNALEKTACFEKEGFCLLDNPCFKILHQEIAIRTLTMILNNVAGKYYAPRYHSLYRVYCAICEEDTAGLTLHGCRVLNLKKSNQTLICRENNDIAGPEMIAPGQKVVWDNRFLCRVSHAAPASLTIAILKPEKATGLLKERYQEAKKTIPKHVIASLPAFYCHGQIIAVPHLEYFRKEVKDYGITAEFLTTAKK